MSSYLPFLFYQWRNPESQPPRMNTQALEHSPQKCYSLFSVCSLQFHGLFDSEHLDVLYKSSFEIQVVH